MDNIKSIDWNWKQGEVLTAIEYESGEKELRENKEPPPTAACHDIAHFICAMHDNLEWDYEKKTKSYCRIQCSICRKYFIIFLPLLL